MLRKQEVTNNTRVISALCGHSTRTNEPSLTGLFKEDWPGCTQPTILYAEVRLPTPPPPPPAPIHIFFKTVPQEQDRETSIQNEVIL